jgi:hypothetical protein
MNTFKLIMSAPGESTRVLELVGPGDDQVCPRLHVEKQVATGGYRRASADVYIYRSVYTL